MITKIYENIKKYMKEYWKWLLLYILLFAMIVVPLPYYLYTGGGTIDINDRVTIEGQSESNGSFNLAYVSSLRATIPTYLLSFLFDTWERVPINTVKLTETETSEDVAIRDKIYLEDANQNAIQLAYQKASKTFTIDEVKNYVVFIMKNADTTLKIGDAILSIEGKPLDNLDQFRQIVQQKKVGDTLHLTVERNHKEQEETIMIQEIDGQKVVGISLLKEAKYQTDPKLTLSFSNNESGPSGGLLLAISIYDKLVPEDLTKGLKIVGTGTIDKDGNVGEIGGVQYKLQGAVKEKADVFLVPNGENYEDCIKLQEKYHYDIKIIGVSTFDEAIQALENL